MAFEVVQEDRENFLHSHIPRSHMYQETRPRFRNYKKNNTQNGVRAINVHQLNRINWETDYVDIDEKTGKIIQDDVDNDSIEDEKDLLNKKTQFEKNVDDDVLRTVKYRNDLRKRDKQNGQDIISKLKRKYGDDVDVNNKSLEELETNEKYHADKDYKTKSYPFGYDESSVYEQELANYPQWFPELSKKYGIK